LGRKFDEMPARRLGCDVARILIVEDNPDSMKLFRLVLEVAGHRVTGLSGGERLVETVRVEQPELILLDIQLPGEDGFQLHARLVAMGAALPPVVALTAHAMAGDKERTLAAGFDGYLTKPIDVTAFAQAVEGFLRGRDSSASGAPDSAQSGDHPSSDRTRRTPGRRGR
jgi:CheY-like chemotaxis protein